MDHNLGLALEMGLEQLDKLDQLVQHVHRNETRYHHRGLCSWKEQSENSVLYQTLQVLLGLHHFEGGQNL